MPPWPKGVSGNPGGRPKGTSLFDAIQRELVKENGDDKVLRAAAKAYAKMLKSGSFNHAKEVMERQDGAVSGELTVKVVFVKPTPPADADGSRNQN